MHTEYAKEETNEQMCELLFFVKDLVEQAISLRHVSRLLLIEKVLLAVFVLFYHT